VSDDKAERRLTRRTVGINQKGNVMCQYCIHKIEPPRPAERSPAAPRAPFGVIEIEAYGEELDLLERAAFASGKSLSAFAAKAALEYAEMYLRAFEAASADLKRSRENDAAQHQ